MELDDSKLDKILAGSGVKPRVTLPTTGNSNVVVGELSGQMVKNMETKEDTLEIRTSTVSYTLPAAQINIDAVSSQIGAQVELKDIKVNVSIAEPHPDTVKIVENTASKGGYQIVVKPVEFETTCTSEDKKISVSKFNGYVERTVAIPNGVDPSKITTGIVLNSDGSFSHVPTQITVIDGKYYAKINSHTNSTYSAIYNPVNFEDVDRHWAEDAVNDMGSRMVVTGIGNSTYEPERSITRAEFAAIVVRPLGLRQGTHERSFGDVALTDWYNGYVDTATQYALITGYDSKSFGPNDTITREQAMVIIARAMKLTGLGVTLTDSETTTFLSNYTDGAQVSAYAKESVGACLKAGIMLCQVNKRRFYMSITARGWKNKSGTGNRSCNCGSWKQHWINCSGKPWPNECSISGCKNKATLGAHIFNSQVVGERIVPACDSCNKMSGTFDIKGGVTLVLANKQATCNN